MNSEDNEESGEDENTNVGGNYFQLVKPLYDEISDSSEECLVDFSFSQLRVRVK